MRHRRPRITFLTLPILFAALLAGTAIGVSRAQPAPVGPAVTANGITLQAGQPLPIFKFNTPQIDPKGTSSLSQRFSEIYARQPVGEERYLGKPRYTVANTDTTSLLTQYGATGGYYAYNVTELGAETPRGAVDAAQAQALACQFLLSNGFVNAQGTLLINGQVGQGVSVPDFQQCAPGAQQLPQASPTALQATLIRLAGQSAQGQNDPVQTIGVVVKVPMALSVGAVGAVPLSVPLGGPGGHISLLFRTTSPNDTGPTLDKGIPGLSAVAMPFYERTFTKLKDAPAVDLTTTQQQVEQRVRAAFPGATNVKIPTPSLLYMVSDAAEEQTAFEPMLDFGGIEVTVDGNTIVLKDVALPAVQAGSGANGFGPTVNITAPANGSTFTPGVNVNFSATIADGTAPYSYQWLLDDGTPLTQETTLNAPGGVILQSNLLPAIAKSGAPTAATVILRVQDADGAQREAVVSLQPALAPGIYIPLINRTASVVQAAAQNQAQTSDVSLAAVNYRFGVEAASDYPPYGVSQPGDLPGVPPDANGFRSGLVSYGWNQVFYWANANAWERDWRDCTLGGSDCTYGVDRADFVYYSGHGGAGGIAPSRKDKDSSWFAAENARFQNARWVGFSSCQTLRVQGFTAPNEPIRRWFNSFRGAHMLLGFNSNMADVAFGPRLFDNMRIPTVLGLLELPWAQLTIRQAWVKTAFDMNAGKPAYIYATSTTVDPKDNKLPKGSDGLLPRPFPVNWYYWVWWDE